MIALSSNEPTARVGRGSLGRPACRVRAMHVLSTSLLSFQAPLKAQKIDAQEGWGPATMNKAQKPHPQWAKDKRKAWVKPQPQPLKGDASVRVSLVVLQ